VLNAYRDEPITLQEALRGPQAQCWKAATNEELASLREMTYTRLLDYLPVGEPLEANSSLEYNIMLTGQMNVIRDAQKVSLTWLTKRQTTEPYQQLRLSTWH